MCLQPLKAWYCNNPNVAKLTFKPPTDMEQYVNNYIEVPCGKCAGCLDDKKRRWVNRLLLENYDKQSGTFITLTYADAPKGLSVSHAQKFLKRFRNAPRDYGVCVPADFKYFLCGERGTLRGRPHYHALMFGVDMFSPSWEPYIAMYKDGYPVWTSGVLQKIWQKGFVTIGEITGKSIQYVAKYVSKSYAEDDSFTLKSQRLGCGVFFDMVKQGKTTTYQFKHPKILENFFRGNIHIPDGRGGSLMVAIPDAYDRYVQSIDEDEYVNVKWCRQIRALNFAHRKKDLKFLANYVDSLNDKNKKEKRKRKLDNEKACLCNS